MEKSCLKKIKLPDEPGVYFFLGKNKQILYIGKATSLINRVASYFAGDLREKRSELIEKMVQEAINIEYTETDSVLEALILETNLIRTHKPKYNTRSKDDKSYNHLIITKEEWPRVLVVRGKDLAEKIDRNEIAYHFGPFPSGQLFREALKIVRRIFAFYDTKQPLGTEKSKLRRGQIDFNRQIGLYPNDNDRKVYLKTIKHIRWFFSGKKKQIIKELEKEMKTMAKNLQFEQAGAIKKKIFALKHIEDIALIKNDYLNYRDDRFNRIEAYDIAHQFGKDMVGVMTVIEGGNSVPSEYRKFTIKDVKKANDPKALREVLRRRLGHNEWKLPNIIVVDGNNVQKKAAEAEIKNSHKDIPVVAVVKNDKHKPERLVGQGTMLSKYQREILLANAEAHRFAIDFHKKTKRKNALR